MLLVQILNEQPADPVNLLQTSLMVKKTANKSASNSSQALSLQASLTPPACSIFFPKVTLQLLFDL